MTEGKLPGEEGSVDQPIQAGVPADPPLDSESVDTAGAVDALTAEGSVFDWDYTITVTPEQYERWKLLIRPKPKSDDASREQVLEDHRRSVSNVGMFLLIAIEEAIDNHDINKMSEGEDHQKLNMHHWPLGDPDGLHVPPGLTVPYVVEAIADWIATDMGRKLAGRTDSLEDVTSTLGLADVLQATRLWFLTTYDLATVTYKKRSNSGGEVSSC